LAAGRPPAPLGVILFFSFGGLFLRFWKANLWRAENGTWLAHLRDVLTNREDKLPEVGKYNAGQKAVFWLMSILIIIRICTGIVIWASISTRSPASSKNGGRSSFTRPPT
jgi:formate dehydrogenase gamma subunit